VNIPGVQDSGDVYFIGPPSYFRQAFDFNSLHLNRSAMTKMWLILLIALTFLPRDTHAQKPGVETSGENRWYQIGKVSASLSEETESIIIVGKDEFSSIKLRVNDEPITINRVQIFFEGGKVQEAEINQPLQAGEETKEINLYAENLKIDKVAFTYKTNANDKAEKAEVELYGLKSYRNATNEASATTEHLQEEAENAVNKVQNDANEAKEKVNEAASKAKAEIIEEKLEGKTGPNGETIYLDDNKNYYWLDEQGTKHYISVLELKDKE
jgi:hypothetical protein